MPLNARIRRSRILVAVATAVAAVLAVALTLALTVTTYDHTSPRAARDKATGSVTGNVDCRKAKCVALTFDGGPSPTTPGLLDILKQHHLHATFFVQGRATSRSIPRSCVASLTRGTKSAITPGLTRG